MATTAGEVAGNPWDRARQSLRAVDRRLAISHRLASGGAQLVISAGQCHELRPLIDEICSTASLIEPWRVVAGAPPASQEELDDVLTRGLGIRPGAMSFEARPGDHRRLDLAFYGEQLDVDDPSHDARAELAARLVLGDDAFFRWIGDVRVEEPDADEPSYVGRFFAASAGQGRPLGDLARALERHIADQRRHRIQRSDLPGRRWAHREYRPPAASDYPRHEDIRASQTLIPEIWDAVMSPFPFFSECFGKETCAYIKTARTDHRSAEDWAGLVTEALTARGAGAVFGISEGHRYQYVHVLIDEVVGAHALIADCLQAHDLPAQAWMLFHDAQWADEWLPLHPDATEPPQ